MLAKVMEKVNTYCISCHSGVAATDFQNLRTNLDWVHAGLVVQGEPENSKLIDYLKFSGSSIPANKRMPSGGLNAASFSQEDYQSFVDWVKNMELPPPSSVGDPGTETLGVLKDFRIGDRKMMASVYRDIYGPDSNTSTFWSLLYQVGTFGGPCDPMEGVLSNDDYACTYTANGFQFHTKVDSLDYAATMTPINNIRREGLRLRLCETLNMTDLTLKYAIGQIRNPAYATSVMSAVLPAIPMPTREDIRMAYGAFYSGEAPSTDVVDELEKLTVAASVTTPLSPKDPWRYLLLTICKTPGWQLY